MVFAIHQHELFTGIHVCSHPETPSHLLPHPIPLGFPKAPTLGALLHASNSHLSSILHMVIYMFQCYSLKSFHPHLLPLSPKVCFLRLCLFCCPACSIVGTIFLNSITLPTKVHLVKAMVFPVVMYGCESWTVKKAEHRRIDDFHFDIWQN